MRGWRFGLVGVAALGGCELAARGRDVLDGLTNPLVTQGLILGIEPAEGELGDVLSRSPYEAGASATVFLADAKDVGDLERAPIAGADVHVVGDTIGSVAATETASGTYLVGPHQGLVYEVGETWTVEVRIGRGTAEATLELPAEATPTLPETHPASTELGLDLSGKGYDSVVLVVLDASGAPTWTNEPKSARDLYDLARGGQVETVTVPAEAFPGGGLYGVGVAGMVHARGRDVTSMNTALSTVMAGRMRFNPVQVSDQDSDR